MRKLFASESPAPADRIRTGPRDRPEPSQTGPLHYLSYFCIKQYWQEQPRKGTQWDDRRHRCRAAPRILPPCLVAPIPRAMERRDLDRPAGRLPGAGLRHDPSRWRPVRPVWRIWSRGAGAALSLRAQAVRAVPTRPPGPDGTAGLTCFRARWKAKWLDGTRLVSADPVHRPLPDPRWPAGGPAGLERIWSETRADAAPRNDGEPSPRASPPHPCSTSSGMPMQSGRRRTGRTLLASRPAFRP